MSDLRRCSFQDRASDRVSVVSVNLHSKLIVLQRFTGDFSVKEASLNQCALSFDNKILATAGDDSVVKVYNMAEDFKSYTSKFELRNCGEMPHTSVDVMRDNSLLLVGSKDANVYIVDLATQKVIQQLSFKC
jgi:WD40 repeat protein